MQRLLLDTHVFLWWLADVPELGDAARKAIADDRNEVFVSAATGWEIAIKRANSLPQATEEDLDRIGQTLTAEAKAFVGRTSSSRNGRPTHPI